jgi:hypothetical protein
VRPRVQPLPGIVRHLPGDEDEIVADDGRHEARAGGRADAWWIDLWISRPGITAISEVEILVSAAKQRSITTEVLGGM